MESVAMNLNCGNTVTPIMPNADLPLLNNINPQSALLDALFPGFSLLSSALLKYSKIDLTLYIPLLLAIGVVVFASQYLQLQVRTFVEEHFMASADIRVDDEIYNMVMSWIANQNFAKRSRRFVANTNLNSRSWSLWRWDNEEEEQNDEVGVDFDADGNAIAAGGRSQKEKKVHFTPSFGTHYFWYKGHLLMFRRTQDIRQTGYGPPSEREEVSVCCFGRNPVILKSLLEDCRKTFLNKDESRTIIYRGGSRPGNTETAWTRCISRVSRPFSTVVLDEKVKESILTDMRKYLHPHSVRWYSNRGIPYRRGYLLYGPPGTGKSSLSFAIAGYFKLKIYIVSLNSQSMDEEKLGSLFAELPKQCVVLLEDIDTAGLTHSRASPSSDDSSSSSSSSTSSSDDGKTTPKEEKGRISLSALLNIIDGVASAEGRILIMTTNHIEKLDPALIRPGRVDMKIKFDLANREMIRTIFKSIFATMEGDFPNQVNMVKIRSPKNGDEVLLLNSEDDKLEKAKVEEEIAQRKKEEDEKVDRLATEFAARIPDMTFSPAEIQGFLLRHKMDPEGAVGGAEEWVVEARDEREVEKQKKEKEEKEALEKEEKEKKEKEEQEKAEKEKEAKDKDKDKDEESSSDSSDSDSESESKKRKKKRSKSKKDKRSKSKGAA